MTLAFLLESMLSYASYNKKLVYKKYYVVSGIGMNLVLYIASWILQNYCNVKVKQARKYLVVEPTTISHEWLLRSAEKISSIYGP